MSLRVSYTATSKFNYDFQYSVKNRFFDPKEINMFTPMDFPLQDIFILRFKLKNQCKENLKFPCEIIIQLPTFIRIQDHCNIVALG